MLAGVKDDTVERTTKHCFAEHKLSRGDQMRSQGRDMIGR